MPIGKQNILMVASSEQDALLYYATGFMAPDPFVFLETAGVKKIFVSELEFGRAKRQAKVEKVLPISQYEKRAAQKNGSSTLPATILEIMLEAGIRKITVPASFPVGLADKLREKGLTIIPDNDLFLEERSQKNADELHAIVQVQRTLEKVMKEVVEILRRSRIRGQTIVFEKTPLSSEWFQKFISVRLLEQGCSGAHTIVAGGDQSCDPHEEGHGLLRPCQPIVFDVFPRSLTTFYYADMSRTFVKGRPSPALTKLFKSVLQAQELALNLIKPGIKGSQVHRAVHQFFEKSGYTTGQQDNKMQGFFHGTGHGVGLSIHENPRLGASNNILRTGEVITVEPGLYYPFLGGIRLEDMVVVTPQGSKNLTHFPKFFEIP